MKLRFVIPGALAFALLLFMARTSDAVRDASPTAALDRSFSSIADMDQVLAAHDIVCTAILPMPTFGAANVEEQQLCTVGESQLTITRVDREITPEGAQNAAQVMGAYFDGVLGDFTLTASHNWMALSTDADLISRIAVLAGDAQTYTP